MVLQPDELRAKLRQLGLSRDVIEAAWPDWWSAEAASSLSATAELSYTVARRLGLSPGSLLENQPTFVWRHEAKFKNLGAEIEAPQVAALTSFGLVVGRAAVRATEPSPQPQTGPASRLRESLLSTFGVVNLGSLLTICWGVGIPVVQLKIFPLDAKHMHAMSTGIDGRHAVLLGQESRFASVMAFTIAHELGHIFLGHFDNQSAIVDMDAPLGSDDSQLLDAHDDADEAEATQFAFELLTGQDQLVVRSTDERPPSGTSLAESAIEAARDRRIDPGLIVLSYAYANSHWPSGYAALRAMGQGNSEVSREINALADMQFDWERVGAGTAQFLRRVLGLAAVDA